MIGDYYDRSFYLLLYFFCPIDYARHQKIHFRTSVITSITLYTRSFAIFDTILFIYYHSIIFMGHEGPPVPGEEQLPRQLPVPGVIPLRAEVLQINGKSWTISSLPRSSVLFNPADSTYTVFVHGANPMLTARMPDLFQQTEPEKPVGRIVLAEEKVMVAGMPIYLSPHERTLLDLLLKHEGEVLDYPTIHDFVWGDGPFDLIRDLGRIKQPIFSLRRKIEADPQHPQHITSAA